MYDTLALVPFLYRTPANWTMKVLRGMSREHLAELKVDSLPEPYRDAYYAEMSYKRTSFSRGGRDSWE